MMKHQDAFHALKEALSTAPVLGYPDFSRKFILETDASLNGLGTILSQQGRDGQIHVIAYASHSLHPQKDQCTTIVQQSQAASTEVGSNREIQRLFIRLVISSIHRQQSTCLCHGE